jgi:hypothetical protein
MRVLSAIIVCSIGVVTSAALTASQGRVDLSGTWEWQAAEGVSRDGVKGPVHVVEVSGGAFNCGKLCAIVQTQQGLTISRPADERVPKKQEVMLQFTGTSGGSQAQWEGDKLQVTNSFNVITIKQTIARHGNRMIVTNVVVAPGADPSPVVQTYLKK